MTPLQANEVLRATADHAISYAQFLYGIANAPRAVELIKEALIVDEAHRASLTKKGQDND